MARTDIDFDLALRNAIDSKTKPIGSLGRVETLAAQIARVQRTLTPRADTCKLIIFAGDHGMAAFGVSAFPQDVTRQMVQNFLAGGAAANVFADSLGVDVDVVDSGVAGAPLDDPRLVSRRLGDGTDNAIEQPAMSERAVRAGLATGEELGRTSNHDVVCFGEMGIGNTSSASLVAAKLLGRPVADLIGRGTGLDDAGLDRKRALLEQAAARTADRLPPETALSEYGGFEIVMMAGAVVGAARAGKIVLVDGFIASVAALSACKLSPEARSNFVFAHRSAERGHRVVLEALDAEPLLDLGLRLGEGTGALLAWPIVKAAAAMLCDMASFDSAGVSGPA